MISLSRKICECAKRIAKKDSGKFSFEQIEKEMRDDVGLAYCRTKDGKRKRIKVERIRGIKQVFVGIPQSWAEVYVFNPDGFSLDPIFDESCDGMGRKPLIGAEILDPATPSGLLEVLTLDDKVNRKTAKQMKRQNAGVKSHGESGFYKSHTEKQLTIPESVQNETDRIKALIGKRKEQLEKNK